jgi:hypothetical protein
MGPLVDDAPPRPIGSSVHQFETDYDDVGRYERFTTRIEQPPADCRWLLAEAVSHLRDRPAPEATR